MAWELRKGCAGGCIQFVFDSHVKEVCIMRRLTFLRSCVLVLGAVVALNAKPSVSFGGYLDSDVWTNFAGNLYSNDELDIGMSIGFGEKVSVDVYATVASGSIPAGETSPGGTSVLGRYVLGTDTLELTESYSRWVAFAFDGISLTYQIPIATFTVGDLVYQYGGFNYYFYKRLSMITAESFTRGLQVEFGGDMVSQKVLVGSADEDTYGDVGAETKLSIGEDHSLGVSYGVRASVTQSFQDAATIYAGISYQGALGEALSLKLDLGYQNLPGSERPSTFAVLFEPALALGKFSLALSYYQFIDPDDTGENFVGDEMFVYVEPGFAFTDHFAAGLPLEIHSGVSLDDFSDNGRFWVVPTAYIYPTDGVEWWVWGQVVVPFADDDLGFGLGSEIIVEF